MLLKQITRLSVAVDKNYNNIVIIVNDDHEISGIIICTDTSNLLQALIVTEFITS